jgi:hypothetical protein
MSDDVWSALAKGSLAFAHSRAGDLTQASFKDAGSLVGSLFDNSPAGTAKLRLDQLKTDIKNVELAVKPVVDAITPKAKAAVDAANRMATEIGTNPFTLEAAGRAATELASVLIALDEAIGIVADKIAEPEPTPAARQSMRDQILGIGEPWRAPFRNLAANASQSFDALCKTVLDIDQAGNQFASLLTWSRADKRLSFKLQKAARKALGPLQFDGASVEAFFAYQDTAKLGIAIKANLKAGLTGDKFLAAIVPAQNATADTSGTAITLDTKDGLTFGDGPNRRLVLPVRLSAPGIELRQFAIARPEGADANSGRIDLMFTIAGNLGGVFAAIVEDAGITIRWTGGANAIEVTPKPPTSAGLRLNSGLLTGGGFLRYKEDTREYGGVLDLQFTKIGITAIGLIGTDPFSLVVVIGVHFMPKIELSWGFTLSGIGGLVAIERRLDSDALRKGIHEGAVAMLLFPEDPVASAPKILDRLAEVFPPQSGGFVIGPMVELGWGSQAGFVKVRLGVVLALPDPRIVVMGTLQVGVPSADVDPILRIVDLRAEIFGEITPDYFLLIITLDGSKIAQYTVSGDIGLLIRWNGGAAFALSVGGFHPKYTPPPELAGLQRVALQMTPPVPILKVRAEAYFAVTGNSIQIGGGLWFSADLGVVSGEAWLTIDALFLWSPRIYFIFVIECGVTIKAFGETVAGVTFHGQLEGTRPWRLEGHASVKILLWRANLDIPTTEWGERDTTTFPPVSPAAQVREALAKNTAWTPQLPAGADAWVRLVEDRATALLVHPLGSLEVKQNSVPLETQIDRIGSSPVTSHRVNLADPTVGGIVAAAVSHAVDKFAPSHFFERKGDQAASGPDFEEYPCGMRVVASTEPARGAASSVVYAWNTVYPNQDFAPEKATWALGKYLSAELTLRNGAVARAARLRDNPYAPASPAQVGVGTRATASAAISIRDPGVMQLAQRADGALRQGGATMSYTMAQRAADGTRSAGARAQISVVAAGVLA